MDKKLIIIALFFSLSYGYSQGEKCQNYGIEFLKEGNYIEAINQFTKSLSISPRDSKTYEFRGNAYMGINETSKAMNDLTKAIQLDSQNISAYKTRGYLKMHLQDYRDAILDFNIVIKNHQNMLNNKTLSDFKELLQDENAVAYSYRAFCKLKLNDFKSANEDAEKAIKYLSNDDGMAYYIRGFYRFNSGNKSQACLDFGKARELGFEDAYQLIQKYCN